MDFPFFNGVIVEAFLLVCTLRYLFVENCHIEVFETDKDVCFMGDIKVMLNGNIAGINHPKSTICLPKCLKLIKMCIDLPLIDTDSLSLTRANNYMLCLVITGRLRVNIHK